LYPLIGQISPDFPPSYACLGRKEQLSLCSLKEYPLGTGRLLASGEPVSKFGFDLWFVKFFFVQGWRVKAARYRKPLVVRTVAIRVVIYLFFLYI
jgi:hypothetical protein